MNVNANFYGVYLNNEFFFANGVMSEFDVEEFIHDIFVRRRLWDGSSGNKDVLWGELSEKFELPSNFY